MKLIIAGSRDFCYYPKLVEILAWCVQHWGRLPDEVVSGGARGADRLGEAWAKENGIKIKRFLANWKELGPAAGPTRNKEMAQYGDYLVVFWDGQSRGTRNMIEEATAAGLPIVIYDYVQEQVVA